MSEKIHDVEIVKADDTYLYLEREYVEVSPSGYGLHWPLIDEDLAVTPLLKQAQELTAELAHIET
jgi:hypothetical protein